MGTDTRNRTPTVFISYRREDAGYFARSLGDRLKRDLRLENVFLDVRDLFGGDDWRAAIAGRIDACDVVIALIGARWAGPRADGTWRIFDSVDAVRWELERALLLRPSHVIPTMLDGARLPSTLPPGLTPLYDAQRLDLQPVTSPAGYCELLADVFMKTHRRHGQPIIVTDGSDEAQVYLDELARQLKDGRLGPDGVVAVTSVTRGFAAVTLREASAYWPDVIVLRNPGADREKLDALLRGVQRNALTVLQAGVLGGAAGVAFTLGQTLIAPTPPDRSGAAGPDQVGSGGPATPRSRLRGLARLGSRQPTTVAAGLGLLVATAVAATILLLPRAVAAEPAPDQTAAAGSTSPTGPFSETGDPSSVSSGPQTTLPDANTTGLPVGNCGFFQRSGDLGAVPVGSTADQDFVAFQVDGCPAGLDTGNMTIGGSGAPAFRLVKASCPGVVSPGSQRCEFSVTFSPAQAGRFEAYVRIPAVGGGAEGDGFISLVGIAVTPATGSTPPVPSTSSTPPPTPSSTVIPTPPTTPSTPPAVPTTPPPVTSTSPPDQQVE